jgi:hypothetical protein
VENFYDAEALKQSGQAGSCWSCKSPIQLPPRIRIGGNVVMLNHDSKLFPHHIDEQRLYDFTRPVAEVVRHPSDPGVWGLKNLSQDKWAATSAGGAVKDVEPGRSLTIAVGARVNFGQSEGEIR